MTEYRDNTLLRGLLLEAAAEDLDALLAETGEVDTTPRFRTSMAALVADPKGWAKRRQRPVWRRAARMAAAILLACVLTLGILMLAALRYTPPSANGSSIGMTPIFFTTSAAITMT